MSILTPAPLVPWAVGNPFRMRPGLVRLALPPAVAGARVGTPPLFVRDALAGDYAEQKHLALTQGSSGLIGEPDVDVLCAIADAYAAQTGIRLLPEARELTLGLQEDFVILHDETEAGGTEVMRTRYLSVCFPSNWLPADKYGLDFTAIHAPVADNALLQAGGSAIVELAFRQSPMLRHVWLLTPGSDLAQHPGSHRCRWNDALERADAAGASGRLIDQVYYRVERQTTLPLPSLRRGVFFIRLMVTSLTAMLALAPERPALLAAALASMSDTVVAYRGMVDVRDRLVAELTRPGA